MRTDYRSYKRFFEESWLELEEQFRKEIVNPQQENDVICYLYHALAKRFLKKKWRLSLIRTEDTRHIRRQLLRPDLNLNDLVFVEVKFYPLRNYRKGWMRRRQNIAYYVKKLEEYIADVKSASSINVRRPVLAIWFWKNERKKRFPLEAKLIDDELERKLEKERDRYKDRVTITYGPRRR